MTTIADQLAAAHVEQRADGDWLVMPCPKFVRCQVPVSLDPPHADPIRGRMWQWDGDRTAPTITPSIGCDNAPRCGQHRVIQKGKW